MVGHALGHLVRTPALAIEKASARSPSEVKRSRICSCKLGWSREWTEKAFHCALKSRRWRLKGKQSNLLKYSKMSTTLKITIVLSVSVKGTVRKFWSSLCCSVWEVQWEMGNKVPCYQECGSGTTLETPAMVPLGGFRTWVSHVMEELEIVLRGRWWLCLLFPTSPSVTDCVQARNAETWVLEPRELRDTKQTTDWALVFQLRQSHVTW